MAGKLTGDDVFQTLFEYCGQKPGATVDHPWGEVVFKVKGKIFAYIGRPGESSGVTVKPAPEELEELLARPNVSLAHYIGRYGWVNVTIDDKPSMDMALRLVDETYEQIAHKKKAGGAKKTAGGGGAPAGETARPAAKKGAAKKSAAPADPGPAGKPAAKRESGAAAGATGDSTADESGKKTAAASRKRSAPKDDATAEGAAKPKRSGRKQPPA